MNSDNEEDEGGAEEDYPHIKLEELLSELKIVDDASEPVLAKDQDDPLSKIMIKKSESTS